MAARLVVGILGDDAGAGGRHDVEPEVLDSVDRVLRAHGLDGHEEPRDVTPWIRGLEGARPIALLRRLAAHIDAGSALPPPGSPETANDRVVKAYRDVAAGVPSEAVGSMLKGTLEFERGFDHLILPQGDMWIAVPHDFEHPIDAGLVVPGTWISSVPRLAEECERLCAALALPAHLESEAPVSTDTDAPSAPAERWRRYAGEAAACAAITDACRQSSVTGAALVAVVRPDIDRTDAVD